MPLVLVGTEDVTHYNHNQQQKQRRVDDALPAEPFTLMPFSILSLLVDLWDN